MVFQGGGASAETLPKTSVGIVKKDKNDKKLIANTEFTLLKKGAGDTFTTVGTFSLTDDKGEATYHGLTNGTYKIVETGFADGYYERQPEILFDNGPSKGAVVQNGIFELDTDSINEGLVFLAYNDRIPGAISLKKTDSDGSSSPLSGASFSLESMNNGSWIPYTTAGTIESNKAGMVTFSGLEWGTYRIVEESAADGYDKNTFKIKQTGSSGSDYKLASEVAITVGATIQKYEFTGQNDKITPAKNPGAFKLIKLDSTNNKPLSGVKFNLYIFTDGVWKYENNGTTDSSGSIEFNNLSNGEYKIEEVNAPKGYKNTIRFVAGDGTFSITDEEKLVSATALNDRVLGRVELKKQDSSNSSPLKDASFSLQIKENGSWVNYKKGKTGTDGKLSFADLPWGEYRLVETGAPSGYDKNTLKYLNGNGTFTVGSNTQSFTFTATNSRLNGAVTIEKYDDENKNSPLAGTVFYIQVRKNGSWKDYKVKGKIVKAVTNKNGKASFKKLPWGKYRVVESDATFGFDINSIKFKDGKNTFTVNSSKQKIQIIAYNTAFAYDDNLDPVVDPVELAEVLGEEAYKNIYGDLPEGYVRGQEAKTGDLSNITPLLIIMLLVSVLLLLAVKQRLKIHGNK